jgi:hypothetical protein
MDNMSQSWLNQGTLQTFPAGENCYGRYAILVGESSRGAVMLLSSKSKNVVPPADLIKTVMARLGMIGSPFIIPLLFRPLPSHK